jgi:hypothetical protein
MSVANLPPPPVPADLDLRDFRWMKLDLIALFNSDFNATPDDTAWRAGVTLWGKAWHQVPAGSLPDDDATLCNLAGLGRDLKTWRRIREVALRGFAKCADGRLYHGYVCQMAMDAAEERRRFEERRSRDRERKKTLHSGGTGDGTPPDSGGQSARLPLEMPKTSGGIPAENAIEGQGQGEGQGETRPAVLRPAGTRGTRLPADWQASERDREYARQQGMPDKEIGREAESFRDYWTARPGQGGVKLDWPATWRTWVRRTCERRGYAPLFAPTEGVSPPKDGHEAAMRLEAGRERRAWPRKQWGPAPNEPGCLIPPELIKPEDGRDWGDWSASQGASH